MELSPDIIAELAEAYAIKAEDIAHYSEAQLRLLALGLATEHQAPPRLRLVALDGQRLD
jgi:hypothetical protein